MISLTNHYSQWGRSEVVIIYPDYITTWYLCSSIPYWESLLYKFLLMDRWFPSPNWVDSKMAKTKSPSHWSTTNPGISEESEKLRFSMGFFSPIFWLNQSKLVSPWRRFQVLMSNMSIHFTEASGCMKPKSFACLLWCATTNLDWRDMFVVAALGIFFLVPSRVSTQLKDILRTLWIIVDCHWEW